jgi:hypothetical protein
MNIFLVKNFFDYEEVIPPPTNLPKDMKTVYLTDSNHNVDLAKSCGWDIVKKTEKFLHLTDKFERRIAIGYIKAYPHKIVPEVLDYDFVFVCDSNIKSIWLEYDSFVNNSSSDYALFITSGNYLVDDTISLELNRSLASERWSYNHSNILECTNRYKSELIDNNIEPDSLSVASAKYIGWNLKHEKYELLSDILYNEICKNLQGNIILTYMSGLYKDYIYNYYTNNYQGGIINSHKFSA